jgi:predicted Co/Zn/Cd cation transporter (cation efflux family)
MAPVIVREHLDASSARSARAGHIEQRTLRISIYGAVVGMVADLTYGLYIAADILVLTGILALLNLAGAGISLLAARLVRRPADATFQHGYTHVEPLVHCANAIMMAVFCLYALITAVESIRAGGHYVNAAHVIWFSALSSFGCLVIWAYKRRISASIDSELLRNDSAKWLVKLALHLATIAGFMVLLLLDDRHRYAWTPFIDSLLVAATALALAPIPIAILRRNVRAILHVVTSDEGLRRRVEDVMASVAREPGVQRYRTRIVEVGRTHFIEIDLLVDERYAGQRIAHQDALRQHIWQVLGEAGEHAWLALNVTQDPRWIRQGTLGENLDAPAPSR